MAEMKDVTRDDIDVMARTLWGEARGETYKGMIAVAWVIRHRAEDGRWPNTIHQVCKQPWQFSCWNGETIGARFQDSNHRAMVNATVQTPGFLRALGVAAGVLAGDLPDDLPGTCHYHTLSVAPTWAAGHIPCGTIGRHAFYDDVA